MSKCGPMVNGYVLRILRSFPLPWENLDSMQLFLVAYLEDLRKVHMLESGELLAMLCEKVGIFKSLLKADGTLACVKWLLKQSDGCFVLQID